VKLEYSGGTNEWALVGDGKTVDAVINVKGESGLTLTFTGLASGERKKAGAPVYIETGYRGRATITVTPSLRTECIDEIGD
jgi:hypothetical protein